MLHSEPWAKQSFLRICVSLLAACTRSKRVLNFRFVFERLGSIGAFWGVASADVWHRTVEGKYKMNPLPRLLSSSAGAALACRLILPPS